MISSDLIHAIENEYQDHKFTDTDVTGHPEWVRDAILWADAQMTADTANAFVQSVMWANKTYGRLSTGQSRGLLNFIRAEVLSADRAAQQIIDTALTGIEPLDLSTLPSGRYAIAHGENSDGLGKVAFYIIDNVKEGKWAGWVFVNILAGDNKLRCGSQRPGQKYQGKHEDLIREIQKDPLAATVLFGRLIGRCGICGRTLTDPESIEAGIGPICAQTVFGMSKKSTIDKVKKILNLK
jgi:hypothetical protein